jgi:hypothetical protein
MFDPDPGTNNPDIRPAPESLLAAVWRASGGAYSGKANLGTRNAVNRAVHVAPAAAAAAPVPPVVTSPAPSAPVAAPAPAPIPTPAPAAATPEAWAAEYAASTALQEQYIDADNYVAFRRADAAGSVRILGTGRPAPSIRSTPGPVSDTALRAEWAASAAIRAEFADDYTLFAAFRKAEARGAVRLLRRSRAA